MRTYMMLVLISAFLTLAACGPTPYQGKGWDAEFAPYVSAFKAEAAAHGKEIPADYLKGLTIQFGDASKNCQDTRSAGCCQFWTGSSKRDITVDKAYWDSRDSGVRFALLYHELGHCLMNYPHRDQVDPVTQEPKSVMNSRVLYGDHFLKHMPEYMNELFSQ